ncbi:unnamed protein product [Peronospora belbahrii]|uniref:AB hydrolase-1 domain-containing protein n=1 Tax=Peronospora belbahrii TaxID=622444 RepID=A0AAU9KJU6_9STRA|nr:unnamed protein product [Peronospora belbahrii]CAH0518576.1 unnamed protein product [Peronospora belbahrii]
MVHGWPDLWFGWRNPIQALSSMMYRLIVPDVRGFGQSSTPQSVESYGAKNICNVLIALLDALEIAKAVFVGHDWGGHMVWRNCLYHPDRAIAVCGVCNTYDPPRKKYLPLWKRLSTSSTHCENFRKWVFDRLVSLLDTLMAVDSNVDHLMFTQRSTLLSEAELNYYIEQYSASKFFSTCQTYATSKIEFQNEQGLPSVINHPALYIGAAKDEVLRPKMAKGMNA